MLTRLIFVAGLFAVAASQAHAQSSVAILAESADVVLSGRVLSVSVGDDGTNIYTYVTLSVTDVLKGTVPETTVVIKQLGGVLEQLGLHVDGQARFSSGEDVLVFLAVRPRDGTLYTVGLSAGAWRVMRNLQSGQPALARDGEIIDFEDVKFAVAASGVRNQPFVTTPPETATGVTSWSPNYTFLTGGPARWHEADQGVRIPVDHTPVPAGLPGGVAALDAAIQTWNNAGTTLGLNRGQSGTGSCPASSFRGTSRIAVYWDDPCGEISDADAATFGVGGGYFTPGFTTTVNGVVFQRFLEGIAILNNTGPHRASAACMQSALTHVLGHTIGLGESSDSTAVMFPTLRPGCSGALSSDDIAGVRAIYSPVLSGNQPPLAPTALGGTVTGTTVVVSWTPAASGGPAQHYILEAGSAPGLANLAAATVASPTTALTFSGVPPGVYYVRVRARNIFGTSGPSQEATINVGACAAPSAPTNLSYTTAGNAVFLEWTPPASQPVQGYILSAGFAPGQSNALATLVPPTPRFSGIAPPGQYYVRVQTLTACGTSAPTPDLLVSVGGCAGPPATPINLRFTKVGNVVTLQWDAPLTGNPPARYRLVAGSAPGASNLATLDTGNNATTFTTAAPNGRYYVRVQGVSDCGVSTFSNEVTIVVP